MLKAKGFKKQYLLFLNWMKKFPYSPRNMKYGQDLAENRLQKKKKISIGGKWRLTEQFITWTKMHWWTLTPN